MIDHVLNWKGNQLNLFILLWVPCTWNQTLNDNLQVVSVSH